MSRNYPGKRHLQTLLGSYLDRTSLVDNSVPLDRPGMRTKKESAFICIAVPLTHNLQAGITENANIMI